MSVSYEYIIVIIFKEDSVIKSSVKVHLINVIKKYYMNYIYDTYYHEDSFSRKREIIMIYGHYIYDTKSKKALFIIFMIHYIMNLSYKYIVIIFTKHNFLKIYHF